MRSVQDRFWSDGWVRKLNPLDRYLFLYLLTNTHSTWCGIYELEISMMAFECGIDERDLEKSMLPKLHPKVIYVDGWVYIPNWVRHHMSESGNISPQQQKGIETAFNKIPERIRLKIKDIEKKGYPIDTLSASASSFASAYICEDKSSLEPPEEDIELCDEDGNPLNPKKKDTRRTKDKEAIFHLFGKKREPWWIHKTQREAALRLFDMKGVDSVKKGLRLMKEHADDQYCPQASTPFEYEKKLPQLKRYLQSL
jgi:hypothetical protein